MFRFIESVRCLDGAYANIAYHQRRVNHAFAAYFPSSKPFTLAEVLAAQKPPREGLYKCRVVYDREGIDVHHQPYEVRPVRSLRLVEDDAITYDHKFERREALEELFGRRGDCDDVLIIKNGMVTDTYYANVVFRKDGQWFTPESFLLPGTMRQSLIDEGRIRAIQVRKEDLPSFELIKLVNSMVRFEGPELGIDRLVS